MTKILVQQSNLYLQQNWRKFVTNAQEIEINIGFNYIMTVNQLPSIPMFWDCNNFVGNVSIQNIFARTRYQVVLQNNHFASNTKQDKTDKGHKIIIICHLNESFEAVLSNEHEQCIDEHVTEFKKFLFLVLTSSGFTTMAWTVQI